MRVEGRYFLVPKEGLVTGFVDGVRRGILFKLVSNGGSLEAKQPHC